MHAQPQIIFFFHNGCATSAHSYIIGAEPPVLHLRPVMGHQRRLAVGASAGLAACIPPMHNIIMALHQTPERANGRTKQKMKHCCKHIPPSWCGRTVHALLWSGQQQGYIPSHWRLRKITYFHCLIATWCNIHAKNVFLSDRQPYPWKYAAKTASLFSLCHIHFARQLQRLNIRNHLFNYFKNLPHAAQLV